MKYEKIADYSNKQFQQITGMKRATFQKIVIILQKAYAKKHQRRERTPKLSIEDLLLATLEYLRKYQTYAHGIAENNIYRGIKRAEGTLIHDGMFLLSERKAPLKSDMKKESHTHVLPDTLVEADTGYLGLADLHSNSKLPKKALKETPVDKVGMPRNQRNFQKARFCGTYHPINEETSYPF